MASSCFAGYCCNPLLCCGQNLAMNTVIANPAVCQSPGSATGDGGASALGTLLNSVGRWGTAVTGIVASSKVQAANIQARTVTRTANTGAFTLIVIVVIIALLIYEVLK